MEIIYKGKDYVVINKPFGWLSERPADGKTGENAPDAIASALQIPPASVYTVHRLDRTTEGLMVYAITKKGAAELSRLIQGGEFKKTYTAYVTADADLARSGEMRDHLFFDRRRDKSFVVKKDKGGAKEAVLTYQLGETFDYKGSAVTVAKIELGTGRTHQIRVHFGSRKSPLIGDGKYGSRVNYKGASLVSTEIEFPWGGEVMRYRIEVTRP